MARVETGHIHLRSSILHHTEGLETKSVKKKKEARTHRNTRTAIGTPACVHTNTENALKRLSYKKTHATIRFTARKPQKQEEHTLFHSGPNKKFYRQTHTHRRTHTNAHRDT